MSTSPSPLGEEAQSKFKRPNPFSQHSTALTYANADRIIKNDIVTSIHEFHVALFITLKNPSYFKHQFSYDKDEFFKQTSTIVF